MNYLSVLFFTLSICNQPKQGATIYVKNKHVFKIVLSCHCGEGFSWKLADTLFSGNVQFQKQDFYPNPNSKPGDEDEQVFTFKAIKRGTMMLHFINVQPFAKKPAAASEEKEYKIIVNN